MSDYTFRQKFVRRVPPKQSIFPAVLGDGIGNLYVPNRTNYVFARINGRIETVYNNKVPPENDLLVVVGRSEQDPDRPGIFQVLSTRTTSPGGINGGAIGGYAPADRYQLFAKGGGQDPLWVNPRQILGLRVSILSGMIIQIDAGMAWNGSAPLFIASSTHDFTAAIPATPGNALIAAVTVNISGAFVYTLGAEFTLASMTTPALMLANFPALPANTARLLAYVRLYAGQTAIQESWTNTDIVDMRFSGISSGLATALTADRVVVTDATGILSTSPTITFDHVYHLLALGNVPTPANTVEGSFQMSGDGYSPAMFLFSYGSGFSPVWEGIAVLGTSGTPLAVIKDTTLARWLASGYDGATDLDSTVSSVRAKGVADEDWNATAHGSRYEIETTPNGTTTKALAVTFESNGDLNNKNHKQTNLADGTNPQDGVNFRQLNAAILFDPVAIKTGDYLATALDYTIICNKATAMTITLPAATGSGRIYNIKSVNIGVVTIDANGSETIDGSLTKLLTLQYDALTIQDYDTGLWGVI